jgi:cell division protein FtsW
MRFSRKANTLASNWWWNCDKVSLGIILTIITVGIIQVVFGSSNNAKRLNYDAAYFIFLQVGYLMVAIAGIVFISHINKELLLKLAKLGFVCCILTIIFIMFAGREINGAKRWISIFGFSLQPTEFLKPISALITAYILTRNESFKRRFIKSLAVILGVCSLVVLQPDLGMTITLLAIWSVQIFVAGLPMRWVLAIGVAGMLGLFAAYTFLPHVHNRVNVYLNPESGDNFQVDKSIEAFISGGFFGRGPGEGIVKKSVPDIHTDFIFALTGEEFGMGVCMLLAVLFWLFCYRSYRRIALETDPFIMLASSGLITQIAFQAFVNMAVSLAILPNKGMTLPFVSYGGSATLGVGLCVGMILSFTRKKVGNIRVFDFTQKV